MNYISLLKKILVVALILTRTNSFSQNLIIPALPAGDSIIIVNSVKINMLFTNIPSRLAKQHTVSGVNFNDVVSDDPETAAANDSTFTLVFPPALPVKLSKITAYHNGVGIQIAWTMQQEIDVDRYEIERSPDGRNFAYTGEVASIGNSNTARVYSFFDSNPFNGLNFYRIKIIDKSGEISYSPVVKVNSKAKETEITVYPNPISNGTFRYSINNLEKGNYTVSVFNKGGQEVIRKDLDHAGGSVIENIILPATFPAGIFEIRLTGEGISINKKLVKN